MNFLTGSTDKLNGEIKIGNIPVSSFVSRIKKIQPDHTDKDTIGFLPHDSLRLRQAFGVLAQHRREVLERRQELSGKLGVRAAEARTLSTGSFASRRNSRPLSLVVLLTRCCALLSLPDSPAGGQVFLRGSKRCC